MDMEYQEETRHTEPIWQTEPMFDVQLPHAHLIDMSGILHRAYHATVSRTNLSDDTPFFRTAFFERVLRDVQDLRLSMRGAHEVMVVWDNVLDTTSYRRSLVPEYKANRKDTRGSDFLKQPEIYAALREMTVLFGMNNVDSDVGFEADDMVAALAYYFHDRQYNVHVHTRDKDLRQLVHLPNINVSNIWEYTYINQYNFKAIFHFPPEAMPFYLALKGDASDNVPGVAGIGEIRAVELVNKMRHFHSYEELREILKKEQGAPKWRDNILKALDDGSLHLYFKAVVLSPAYHYHAYFDRLDMSLKRGDWHGLAQMCDQWNCQTFKRKYVEPVLEKLREKELTYDEPTVEM